MEEAIGSTSSDTCSVPKTTQFHPQEIDPSIVQYANMYVYTDTICSCRTPVGHSMFHILHWQLGNASHVL